MAGVAGFRADDLTALDRSANVVLQLLLVETVVAACYELGEAARAVCNEADNALTGEERLEYAHLRVQLHPFCEDRPGRDGL